MPLQTLALTLTESWPFVVLASSVAFIVVAITKMKFHPFLALILAAIFAGCLARVMPGSTAGPDGVPVIGSLTSVLALTVDGFGRTAGGVAISIALASIIGFCLMESGAADRVVRRFLQAFGERNAGAALLVSTYVLSIPIFFDTMFMLMAPLAKALYVRTGKNYLLYVLCVCCGGVITHSLTVPHPGPIAAVDALKIDVGLSILGGICAGIIPAIIGFGIANFLNSRMTVPLRETMGATKQELEAIIDKPLSQLPSMIGSMMPIILPIALISFSSGLKVAEGMNVPWLVAPVVVSPAGDPLPVDTPGLRYGGLREVLHFIGDRNIALFIGAFLSIILLARQLKYDRATIGRVLGPPLETAGIIILITSAGGAFGYMIRNAGVGGAVERMSDGMGLSLIVLSYVLTFIIRVAQGSATVAMLTGAMIMAPMLGPDLPYHSLYIFLAIGFASFAASWMNDSGFWVVSRLSGMTEKETLKSFTVLLTVVSISGLVVTWLGSKFFPLV